MSVRGLEVFKGGAGGSGGSGGSGGQPCKKFMESCTSDSQCCSKSCDKDFGSCNL